MKNKNIILYIIGLIMFTSCQDMFEPADENTRQEDAMHVESDYANGLLMYGYSSLPYLTTTQTDIATDDATTNQLSNGLLNMALGTWAADATPTPINRWDACLGAIQYVNKFIVDIVKQTQWTPSSPSKQIMFVDRLKGEAFALRAMFYYHLLQAHGGYSEDGELLGVPLFTEPLRAGDNFDLKRESFAKCVKQVFADCDSAMALLPLDYKNISDTLEIPEKYMKEHAVIPGYNAVFGASQRNRISGRIAMCVKAQVALLAASPAFRDQSDVTPLQAAELCADVLTANNGTNPLEAFDETGHLDWYSSTYKTIIDANCPEVIWRADRSLDNTQEKDLFPPSIFGNGRVNPSQNLVDAFPMNNGLPIDDPESGYDPQNPYKNRDMRLSNTVIYNGMKFKTANILTGVEMGYGNNNQEFDDNLDNRAGLSTRTGYYLKKLLREDVSANPSSTSPKNHLYVRMRYTEFFLAYAEAINDALGPNKYSTTYKNKSGKSFPVTAYQVIKKIRERAGIGKDEFGRDLPEGDIYLERIKDDAEKMTQLIRNERRLELCFENKRFWDLRRWKMPLNEGIKGMKIERTNPKDPDSDLKYSVFDVEERVFDSSYQCYGPIPRAEVLKWSNLKQNKGWK